MSRRSVLISLGLVLVGTATAVVIFMISISLSEDRGDEIVELVPTVDATERATAVPLLTTRVPAAAPKPAFVLNTVTAELIAPLEELVSDEAAASAASEPTPEPKTYPIPTASSPEDNSEATEESPAAAAATTTKATEEPNQAPTSTQQNEATAITLHQPAASLNGIPIDQIVVMPDEVKQRAQEIFDVGQQKGRNPRAFSKVGDSTIENPHFLARFDDGPYDLGIYSYLQPTIDYYT